MRKKHLASLAVAGIASLSIISVAHADGYEPAGKAMAAPVADYAWGGLYIGVGVGGASFDNNVGVDASKSVQKEKCRRVKRYDGKYKCKDKRGWRPDGKPHTEHKSAQFGDDEWNVFGTLQVGYDHLMGKRFLVGVFGDVDFYWDAENNFSEPWIKRYRRRSKSKEIGSFDGHIDLERIWNVGARAGFLVMPHWLIYGGGGYSRAELDGAIDVTFKGDRRRRRRCRGSRCDTVLSVNAPDNLDGYFLEGGTEFKLHRNVSLKLAYRYQDLDGFSASASAHHEGHPYGGRERGYKRFVKDFTEKASFDAEIHSIRATLVIGLNPVPRAVVPLK